MKNSFQQVSIRLVDDAPLISEESLTTPEKIVSELAKQIFSKLDREEMCIVNFTSDMKPINFSVASVGTINNSVVHPRELLKSSILSNAAYVVLIHNHPSGSLKPSKADLEATRRLACAFKLMGIDLLDHIIVGGRNTNEYFSILKEDAFALNDVKLDYNQSVPNVKYLGDLIEKNIYMINWADEFAFWQNRHSLTLPLTETEAELLISYEDMNEKSFCVEGDELFLRDNKTMQLKKCDLNEEIYSVCEYISNKIKEISISHDSVESEEVEDLKTMDEICQSLFEKTSLGKNLELGSVINTSEQKGGRKI